MINFEELVFKAKNHESMAFSELILYIEKNLHRIAQTKLDNKEDISDAMQETIIIAFYSLDTLDSPKHFKTWITRILINECNHIHKKNKKMFSLYNKLAVHQNEYYDGKLGKVEDKLELEDLFCVLNGKEKLCILLLYVEKYSINEIAEILNTSPNTIKSRINCA